jgi:hypothetical protein
MANSSKAAQCCSMEKLRLMKELERCNFCTDNYEEFHNCYRQAARESGERSRTCVIS